MSRTRLMLVCSIGLILLYSATASAADRALHLRSPLDYQVFQRESRLKGTIVIRGAKHGNAPVQVRLVGKPLQGELPADWQTLDVEGDLGVYEGHLAAPAGGWYRLEVRVGDQTDVVEHVGIGEVFVVAGQSNSTNYGSEKQKPASGMVVSFDGTKWAIADDPQPGVFDKSKGGSFIPAFGDAMVKRFGVPVAIASTGAGATSVRQWLMKGETIEVHPTLDAFVKTVGPGKWQCTGALYDHLMERVKALGPHGFRAVLWHQGESDAGQARAGYPADRQISARQYTELLEKIIRASRKDAGWEIPWFVAKATYHSEKDPADREFRAAQQAVCDDGTAMAGADSDSLGREYRAGVHFNGRGLKAHGELWARTIGDYLDKVMGEQKR